MLEACLCLRKVSGHTVSEPSFHRPDLPLSATLLRLEQRLARLEQHLQLPPLDCLPPSETISPPAPEPIPLALAAAAPAAEELEFVVGQNWFAGVGVLVLTCGVGFALSLPLSGLPPGLPAGLGAALAGGLFLGALFWQKSFHLVAGCLRGAGLALLFFSTLRLFFFGATPVLAVASPGGGLILFAVVAVNLAVALQQKSPGLLGLALLTGLIAALAIGAPFVVFFSVALLSGIAAFAARGCRWPGLLLGAIPAAYLTHLLWVLNRPWSGRPFQLLAEPSAGIFFPLLYAVILALGSLLRRDRTAEAPVTVLAAGLNCALGYGLILLSSPALAGAWFAPAHLAAALVYLGLALAFWRSEASRFATFFYAMTGYLALSVALLKVFPVPPVFLWLSGQSLVVVITALWFRSRLIVVANFFISVAIVLAYLAVARQETGISLGFGVVALLTARLLNWKKARLQLETQLMRNAYLASAFVLFPYALYHLVPRAYVSLSWVAVAIVYYLMNFIVQNLKYRWLGHLTLLLTVAYVLLVGLTPLAPAYRIISFLVLGSVLLGVSLIFTRVRARRKRAALEVER